jgi:CRP-like cAMP-binding protein
MKTIDYFWDHPELKRFHREVKTGQYLFRQRQQGNTMFIILRGLIELIAERGGKEYVITIIDSGQFLGEKAIVRDQPYQRAYSARAKVDSTILEMSLKAIEAVRKVAPEIMNDIFKHIFTIAALRLDRANYLTAGLRSSNNVERLIHLILYFARSLGRKGPNGTELLLTPENIYYYIDMSPEKISSCLHELANKKLIVREGEDFYSLPDEQALISSMPNLKEQLAKGYFDELEMAP